jgi:hypothetical protein
MQFAIATSTFLHFSQRRNLTGAHLDGLPELFFLGPPIHLNVVKLKYSTLTSVRKLRNDVERIPVSDRKREVRIQYLMHGYCV